MDVDALLQGLQSQDWRVAVKAATELQTVPGERVTRALAEALDAFDTAITDAATESLIVRDDWLAVDLMWTALTTLEDDVTDQMWSVIDHSDSRISQELNRRYDNQA